MASDGLQHTNPDQHGKTVRRCRLGLARASVVVFFAACLRHETAPPAVHPPTTPEVGREAPKIATATAIEETTWARESVHPIRFTVPADLGAIDPAVTLVESTDDGATWSVIGEVFAVEGYFHWTLPSTFSRARVGVRFHRTDPEGTLSTVRLVELKKVLLGPSTKKAYLWKRTAVNAPFGPRDGAGGIVHEGRMWLLGGWNPTAFPRICANDVWSSADGTTWRLEKPNTFTSHFRPEADWEGRHFAGYHSYRGKMWIVGGDPNQGYYQTDVWSSENGRTWTRTDLHTTKPRTDPSNGYVYPASDWRPVEESQFGMRTAHVTATFRDKLWVMGGQRNTDFVDPDWPGGPSKAFDDIWTTEDGAAFTRVETTGALWSPRGYVSEAVTLDGRLWLIGGGLHDDHRGGRPERSYYNDVWSTMDGSRWVSVADEAPFSPRIWHNVKSFDGRLWVINGYDGAELGQGRRADNRADVWASTDGLNWYDVSPPASFVPRHAGTAWVHDGSLFVGSGNAIVGKWHADVWRMTPVSP